MNQESAFLQAIRENPTDDTPRLIFADWLEERGDPRSEVLRLLNQFPTVVGRTKDKFTHRIQELLGPLDPTQTVVHSTHLPMHLSAIAERNPQVHTINVIDVPATLEGIETCINQLRGISFLTHVELVLDGPELENMQQAIQEGFFQRVGTFIPFLKISYADDRPLLDWEQIGMEKAQSMRERIGAEAAITDTASSMMANRQQFIAPINTRYKECQRIPETIDLLYLQPRDLGLETYATMNELYAAATASKLELCPLEIALCIQHIFGDINQNDFYECHIAMSPIEDFLGDPAIFRTGYNNNGLWLSLWEADLLYAPNSYIVFRLRRGEEQKGA